MTSENRIIAVTERKDKIMADWEWSWFNVAEICQKGRQTQTLSGRTLCKGETEVRVMLLHP